MIDTLINRSQAEALFESEAVLLAEPRAGFGPVYAIPEYRCVELFGENIATWIECHYGINSKSNVNWLKALNDMYWCRDLDECGAGINFFTQTGFNKIIAAHNSHIAAITHATSAAGKTVESALDYRRSKLS